MNQVIQDTVGVDTVILPVRKQEHVDFLRDMFNAARGESIRLTRHEFVGKFIFSLRSYSDTPRQTKVPQGYEQVRVILPDTPYSTAGKRFAWFTAEAVEQINNFLSATFDLYFHIYFLDTRDLDRLEDESGLKEVPITREMLVDSFVFGLDMVDFSRANETIKKREYRRQMKELARKREMLLKKSYALRRKIYDKRRKYLKDMLFVSVK